MQRTPGGSAAIRSRIESFFATVYKVYGLRNGEVRFVDIDAKYRTNATLEDLAEVFEQSKLGPVNQGLNVFLSEDAGEWWWGMSGGLPGAANTSGTPQSGILLASVPNRALMEGVVLAHEAGHFLGLNHTADRAGLDPLPDTPFCSGDGGCEDARNIMFGLGLMTTQVESSPMQRRVVHGSPVFQAFTTGAPQAAASRMNAVALPDIGELFGHPGVPPSYAEQLVLSATCGHPLHHRSRLNFWERAEVERISVRPGTMTLIQNAAKHLLQQP